MTTTPTLARKIGLPGALVIGLSSMLGAGVYAVFGTAAATAGSALILSLGIAAVVAYCNATSTAQLAAAHPSSGGVYVYGRAELGPWAGFTAGWMFVVGKTASCAAMALTFATYAVPADWQRPAAVAAIILLTVVNYRGITRTTRMATVILGITLTALVMIVGAGLSTGLPYRTDLSDWMPTANATGWYGTAQAAGLLFFAFAGYARIATLGDEVRNPARTIPRAIHTALLFVVILYLVIAVTSIGTLGIDQLAHSPRPLAAVAEAGGAGSLVLVVQIGGATASLGALLALITGISRTTYAMAKEHDLPTWFAAVHPRFAVPHHAELALGGLLIVAVLTTDLRDAIGFSSFGVLLYYLIANVSALKQDVTARRYPRALALPGATGCAGLMFTLPLTSILTGMAVLAVGLGLRLVMLHRGQAAEKP